MGWTRGLHERLADNFSANAIFYDVDDITYGEDFFSAVVRNLADCRVFLVVIGPNWLTVKNSDGGRRLDTPEDHVRREIELAFERRIKIIPVLVGGALMPAAHELPHSIRFLSKLNALPVSDTRFSDDMEQLVYVIRSSCGEQPRQQRITEQPKYEYVRQQKSSGFSWAKLLLGLGIASVIGVIGLVFLLFLAYLTGGQPSSELVEINNSNALAERYCQGFADGAKQQMMYYGQTEMPSCYAPSNLEAVNQQYDVYCVGQINGQSEVFKLQAPDSPPFAYNYDGCLK
jgi:hypothetical protein